MIRKRLIAAGVKDLKEFGYPSVNETNILTDEVYSRFFCGILRENLGKSSLSDIVIEKFIAEIDANINKEP